MSVVFFLPAFISPFMPNALSKFVLIIDVIFSYLYVPSNQPCYVLLLTITTAGSQPSSLPRKTTIGTTAPSTLPPACPALRRRPTKPSSSWPSSSPSSPCSSKSVRSGPTGARAPQSGRRTLVAPTAVLLTRLWPQPRLQTLPDNAISSCDSDYTCQRPLLRSIHESASTSCTGKRSRPSPARWGFDTPFLSLFYTTMIPQLTLALIEHLPLILMMFILLISLHTNVPSLMSVRLEHAWTTWRTRE